MEASKKTPLEIFDTYASLYEDKFMDVSKYARSLDVFRSLIPKEDARILEVACGPGNFTKYLLNLEPHYSILGTDIAPNMLALAKRNNPSAEFKLLDCREIASLNQQFDAFLCAFCLPYVSPEETIALFRDAAALLTPNSALYCSTMESNPATSRWESGQKGQLFMHYHSEESLTAALHANGFKVADVQRLSYVDHNEKAVVDLCLTAIKD